MRTVEQFILCIRVHMLGIVRDIVPADSSRSGLGTQNRSGRPILNEFNGQPFHIALARPSGSFEFTYAEIGLGTTSVTGDMEMAFEDSWAHYCVHHFNQDGLVRERSRLTAWLDARVRETEP